MRTEADIGMMEKDRGRGHEPRNAKQPLEAGKGKEIDSPVEPPKGTQPY